MTIDDKVRRAKDDLDRVYAAGREAGRADGGFGEGYEAARAELWNGLQNGGTRTDYMYAFAYWASEYIRPTRKVVPTAPYGANNTFYYCRSVKKIEKDYFDFSQKEYGGNGYYYTFTTCSALETVEDIGLIPQPSYNYAFAWCIKLETIAKIGADETTTFKGTFTSCSTLKNITVEGTIGQSVSFADSPLTADSAISVITHLKSFHGASNAYSQTLTFSAKTWAALDALGAASPANTTWRHYVEQELAWNT